MKGKLTGLEISDKIDPDEVLDLMHSDYLRGWCVLCGAEHTGVYRWQKDIPCPTCGQNGLWGSYALVEELTGVPAPPWMHEEENDDD